MSSISENVDRLTCLPEEIISHILSLIPIRLAVQTSILSKRWRYTWMLLKKLAFNDYPYILDRDPLSKFVDNVFELYKTSHIEVFRLHFSDNWVRKSNVSKWINEALRLNVREIDIQVKLLELPLRLFTCKTLTKLRLIVNCNDPDVFEVPSPVILPCLKTLEISVNGKPCTNAFILINGSPILESLFLEVAWRNDEEEYNFNIPTLKRLELRTRKCLSVINKVVLNVPNLEYFLVGGVLCSLFVMKDLSNLVEATFSFYEIRFSHLMSELLKGISEAKSLSWSTSNIDLPIPLNSPLPKFLNLKRLELKGSCSRWLSMFHVLENSCELEHLCIDEPEEFCWIEPQQIPTCMLSNLKTFKFKRCNGRKWDLQFLEYMLGNSEVLKTLTIITSETLSPKKEMWLCAQLLKFPRASRSCEIHFVGNSAYN
ncbi:unnamed protein product [Lactuca saligna]|uniref:FBD domain-containing protein n=1 Tax=Lactuca saligna TaxID=75948 RepID=A0AA36ENF3_LACSI|nr:unnamed protein product [Lactuca saligna]